MVLADAERGDWILCQVTSKAYGDKRAVELDPVDFAAGSLRTTSFARPAKLFTANKNLILGQVGTLKFNVMLRIVDAVIGILRLNRAP